MYATVLSGAPPNTLQKGLVGKHQQTWKLREHYLLEEDERRAAASSTPPPLSAGNPLRAWIPTGSKLAEHRDGVTVEEPGRSSPLRYVSASVLPPDSRNKIIDILITGEVCPCILHCFSRGTFGLERWLMSTRVTRLGVSSASSDASVPVMVS